MSNLEKNGIPSNTDAERILLGALINGQDEFERIASIVRVNDFHLDKHRKIFTRMSALRERGAGVDYVTLADELKNNGELESIDGISYLVSLTDGLPEIYSIDSYANIVKEKATLRRVIHACDSTISACVNQADAAATVIQRLEERLSGLSSDASTATGVSLEEYIENFPGGIDALVDIPNKRKGIPSGFPCMDDFTGGLRPGEMRLIGARPGTGKTAYALQIARNVASKTNKRTLFFSLEMSKDDLVDRLLASQSQLDYGRIRKSMSKEDVDELKKAAGWLHTFPIIIDDKSLIDVSYIRRAIAAYRKDEEIAAVFIDYIQQMTTTERVRDRYEQFTLISQQLTDLAKRTGIPFVVVSQLRRPYGREGEKPPSMSDLRETGQLEQDAHVIVLLHRDPKTKNRASRGKVVQAIIEKNRFGETGVVEYEFDGATSTFIEQTPVKEEEEEYV